VISVLLSTMFRGRRRRAVARDRHSLAVAISYRARFMPGEALSLVQGGGSGRNSWSEWHHATTSFRGGLMRRMSRGFKRVGPGSDRLRKGCGQLAEQDGTGDSSQHRAVCPSRRGAMLLIGNETNCISSRPACCSTGHSVTSPLLSGP